MSTKLGALTLLCPRTDRKLENSATNRSKSCHHQSETNNASVSDPHCFRIEEAASREACGWAGWLFLAGQLIGNCRHGRRPWQKGEVIRNPWLEMRGWMSRNGTATDDDVLYNGRRSCGRYELAQPLTPCLLPDLQLPTCKTRTDRC